MFSVLSFTIQASKTFTLENGLWAGQWSMATARSGNYIGLIFSVYLIFFTRKEEQHCALLCGVQSCSKSFGGQRLQLICKHKTIQFRFPLATGLTVRIFRESFLGKVFQYFRRPFIFKSNSFNLTQENIFCTVNTNQFQNIFSVSFYNT